MAVVRLSLDQEEALSKMKNGCILNGRVGSGKSRTGLAFYYTSCGGEINTSSLVKMKNPLDLYIITTAKKRDTLEWEGELANFYMSTDPKTNKIYKNKIIIDSWNNVAKYRKVRNAFFIFDEQRVVGYGQWARSFIEIAKNNKWILLSATPGDTWMDYIPVFIANGFFKNKTDFIQKHVIYSRFTSYPKIDKYINESRLIKFRDLILVNMNYKNNTESHYENVLIDYDEKLYKYVVRNRWNIYKQKPIENASEYCAVLRRIINSSVDKQIKLFDIIEERKKAIIFYSYNYELDILRELFNGRYIIGEWNGQKHEPVPTGDRWVYLVEYVAGAEGWNCITTDTVIFFSQCYSYKMMVQAAGRIDRRNTPYKHLYYYTLKSNAKIDSAISKTLKNKKKFSEKGFAPKFYKTDSDKEIPEIDIEKRCDIYYSWKDPNNIFYEGNNETDFGGKYLNW